LSSSQCGQQSIGLACALIGMDKFFHLDYPKPEPGAGQDALVSLEVNFFSVAIYTFAVDIENGQHEPWTGTGLLFIP
jgi:hypothetical protein